MLNLVASLSPSARPFSLWHELSGVVYPREHALVTLAMQRLAKDEVVYASGVLDVWRRLDEVLEDMPLE